MINRTKVSTRGDLYRLLNNFGSALPNGSTRKEIEQNTAFSKPNFD